jgi:hypothetical protein
VTKPASLAATMSEDDLLEDVIQLARALRWRVAHFRPARTEQGYRTAVQGDGKGFPDLVMTRTQPPRILVAELKSMTGRTSPEQLAWLASFVVTVGDENVFVWNPEQWVDGTIEAELRR